jgi:gluconate 2-dehydrogenase gamma chain
MKNNQKHSRRSFLGNAGGTLGSGWLALQGPLFVAAANAACSRREAGESFANLTEDDAATIEAVAEQIIPADDSPGAREAGVIWFIDEFMGGNRAAMRPALEAGARDLDLRAPGDSRFVDLTFEDQAAILRGIESSSFFSSVRFLTIAGMFAMPSHGGNRDKDGWAVIGFADRYAWKPPFGFYDAAANLSARDDEA